MSLKANINNISKLSKFKMYVASVGVAVAITSMSGCDSSNYDMWDSNYTFTHAVIFEENKTTIVPIKQWSDYEGEQIQIITEEGNVFLTSAFNTKLFNEDNGSLSVEDFAISLSPSDAEISYLEKQDSAKIKIKK